MGEGEEVTLPVDNATYHITFTGGEDTQGLVVINGVNYLAGDVGGAFVWDIGEVGEHTFSAIGETISRDADGVPFDITWDGTGSQHYQVAISFVYDYGYSPVSLSASELFNISDLDEDTVIVKW